MVKNTTNGYVKYFLSGVFSKSGQHFLKNYYKSHNLGLNSDITVDIKIPGAQGQIF